MSFPPPSSKGSASSPFPPYLSSPGLQRSRVYQDTPWQNLGDMRFDDPRPPVMLPNQDPLAFHSRVALDPYQNVDSYFSRLPSIPMGSYYQQPDLSVSGPAMYQAIGSTADVHRPAYVASPYTYNANLTMPSTGPSGFGGEQPAQALLWRPYGTAQPQPMIAAPTPPPPPLLPFNRDPMPPHHYSAAQAVQSQDLEVDVIGWPPVAGGENTSTRVPPDTHRRRPRQVPLVRVEDRVVWVRQDVLKLTLFLNLSPNADAEAHEPWGPESPHVPPQ